MFAVFDFAKSGVIEILDNLIDRELHVLQRIFFFFQFKQVILASKKNEKINKRGTDRKEKPIYFALPKVCWEAGVLDFLPLQKPAFWKSLKTWSNSRFS